MRPAELVERHVESSDRWDALVPVVRRAADRLGTGRALDWLQGVPISHALHPLLTDLPIGCFTSASILDVVGGRSARPMARRLVGIGLLSVVPTGAAGLAEVPTITEDRNVRTAAGHAGLNGAATVLYLFSWRSRRHERHVRGAMWALAGATVLSMSGYLGGHLAFARSVGGGKRDDAGERTVRAGTGTLLADPMNGEPALSGVPTL